MIRIYQKKVSNFIFLSILVCLVATCLLGSASFITGFFSGISVGLINMFLLLFVIPENNAVMNVLGNFFQKFFIRVSLMSILFLAFLLLCKVNLVSFILGFSFIFITATVIISKSLLVCVKE